MKWLPDEIEYLEKIADDVPFPLLVKRMAKQAAQHGWPVRTARAISTKLYRKGYQCRCRFGGWVTTGAVAQIFGCKNSRINRWVHQHGIRKILEPLKVGSRWYIKRSAWRRLAIEMPQALGGYSSDALFLLLEDRELADSVARNHPLRSSDYRVRCIETGQIWPSASAAARDLYISHETISKAARSRKPVPSLGLTFEALRRV